MPLPADRPQPGQELVRVLVLRAGVTAVLQEGVEVLDRLHSCSAASSASVFPCQESSAGGRAFDFEREHVAAAAVEDRRSGGDEPAADLVAPVGDLALRGVVGASVGGGATVRGASNHGVAGSVDRSRGEREGRCHRGTAVGAGGARERKKSARGRRRLETLSDRRGDAEPRHGCLPTGFSRLRLGRGARSGLGAGFPAGDLVQENALPGQGKEPAM